MTSSLLLGSHAGDHAVEERGRGAEEHVPSGRHRVPEVRGLRCLRERSGASGQGGERLDVAPHLGTPPPRTSSQRHLGQAAVFTCWDEEGRLPCSNSV